jgi:tRNA-specific 2-thiouridylase
MKRILAALSGGVDSSTAAWLLKQDGWEVEGVTFRLWSDPASEVKPDPARDAAEVCAHLGIVHHVVDVRERFKREIVDAFRDAYFSGRTPNPCCLCNPKIKFAVLEEMAAHLGADAVATGHYARVGGPDRTGRMHLLKGLAPEKEQSYFLFGLTQNQLRLAELPLGAWDKARVRAAARAACLPVHAKPESQEICFIPDDNYEALLERLAPELIRPGEIVDTAGNVLGRHDGIHRFTIGQRKRLGIAVGKPVFVTRILPASATVVVGDREETLARAFTVEGVNWVSMGPQAGPFPATVKIRYAHPVAAATVTPSQDGTTARVVCAEPQGAITPGQAAVFYASNRVLAGGCIASVD